MDIKRSERIYQWWLTHRTKNKEKWSYASIARMFHCSREWVRVVIEREEKKRIILTNRAYQIAIDNMNAKDTLVER